MSQDRSAQLRCLARGLTLGCGVCGRRRGLFRRGVVMVERCPRCSLTFERTEGHYIGAIGINTILSFTALFFGLIVFVAATYPDTPAGAWVFALLPVLALVPLLLYPVSKTLWTSIDLLMRPLEPGEALPETEWR
mgnify:FL=1